MAQHNELQSLKMIAKRLARESRIAHHNALDLIASQFGQAHWIALTSAWENGWRPEPKMLESLLNPTDSANAALMAIPSLGMGLGVEEHGTIDGHPYSLEIDFEVLMGGNGWCILLEHAPSESPVIEVYDRNESNPILNPEFKAKALAICHEAADRLRARIAVDWPRRSTKPDADGRAQHPLSKGVSSEWHCLHCDGAFSGAQMAENMWHCPECNATPIDIFAEPFWKAA
jgi:hypothetical protein